MHSGSGWCICFRPQKSHFPDEWERTAADIRSHMWALKYSVRVKAVIYNANTQTRTPKRHMNHLNPLSTGLLQRRCGVDAEICHFSLLFIESSVSASHEGRLGSGSDGCCTDDGQRRLLKRKSALMEAGEFKLRWRQCCAHDIDPGRVGEFLQWPHTRTRTCF